jgi:hypothetical protein
VIVAYIDSYRSRFGVEPICTVLTEHGVPIAHRHSLGVAEPRKDPVIS